ncbi:hypothetical protein [Pontiella agarivorans]|uniref:Uncharacterized protein n=1 Tax=Pontiella agarivorans TaxID=3038953 RepID=A0ABU5MU22_9BACT|nr:hypothetical protein [Pontiella agarivorans]MDZ8117724.1 hypothetical protein [Pontiella agarivorans]
MHHIEHSHSESFFSAPFATRFLPTAASGKLPAPDKKSLQGSKRRSTNKMLKTKPHHRPDTKKPAPETDAGKKVAHPSGVEPETS